jgi:hypothetical protein
MKTTSASTMPVVGGTRKSRRANRKSRRMRGGMAKRLRFTVDLKNNQMIMDDSFLIDNIRDNTQFYTRMFKDTIDMLLQYNHIKESDATDFEITYIEENIFELRFDFLYQRENAKTKLDTYIKTIMEYFNNININFVGGTQYSVIATIQ